MFKQNPISLRVGLDGRPGDNWAITVQYRHKVVNDGMRPFAVIDFTDEDGNDILTLHAHNPLALNSLAYAVGRASNELNRLLQAWLQQQQDTADEEESTSPPEVSSRLLVDAECESYPQQADEI